MTISWIMALGIAYLVSLSYTKALPSFALGFAPPTPGTVELVMQVLISMALLVAGFYVILSNNYQAAEKHWAYGAMGTVIGFWLKPSRRK